MSLLYAQGIITRESFKKACNDAGLKPQGVVLVFPGNPSHNGPHITLFSIKSGGGLAAVAKELGEAGYPTLSLPTTSMENWLSDEKQQIIARDAIADLYRAWGAGFHLMLPVRDHQDSQYFDEGLAYSDGQLEPNFWGGIQSTPNKPLANYYLDELNRLQEFTLLLKDDQAQKAQQNQSQFFMAAFLAGRTLTPMDKWLQTVGEHDIPHVKANPAVNGMPKLNKRR